MEEWVACSQGMRKWLGCGVTGEEGNLQVRSSVLTRQKRKGGVLGTSLSKEWCEKANTLLTIWSLKKGKASSRGCFSNAGRVD